MSLPALVVYKTEAEYKNHFIKKYCRRKIVTFDGVEVNFYESKFSHAFYRGIEKTSFSRERAERIDWIAYALTNKSAMRYAGWNSKKKRPDNQRRVYFINNDYAVVIRLKGKNKADFITAYIVDSKALPKLTGMPKITK